MTTRWLALSLLAVACKDEPVATAPRDSAPAPSSVAVESPADADVPKVDASGIAALTVPCRLIAVMGDARSALDAGLRGLEAAPEDFITLAAGASMTAKDGKTSREVTIKGPGRARVCVGGREEEWLSEGEIASVPGAGESPGAEVWVMTLHGAIRYGVGHTHITASRASTSVRAQLGASVYPLPSAVVKSEAGAPVADAGWLHAAADATVELNGPVDGKALLGACIRQATVAQDLAKAMLAGDAGPLGDAASRHVVERRRARALCGMALLAAATAAPFSKADADAAASADLVWRQVPAPPTQNR